MGPLLQISLDVREEPYHRSLLQLALEFGDERDRLHAIAVQVEDDE